MDLAIESSIFSTTSYITSRRKRDLEGLLFSCLQLTAEHSLGRVVKFWPGKQAYQRACCQVTSTRRRTSEPVSSGHAFQHVQLGALNVHLEQVDAGQALGSLATTPRCQRHNTCQCATWHAQQ